MRPLIVRGLGWYEVIGVVDNLPVTTDARVAYRPTVPGRIHPAHLQLRLRGGSVGLAERLRDVGARSVSDRRWSLSRGS
jgi:hypothetical protein